MYSLILGSPAGLTKLTKLKANIGTDTPYLLDRYGVLRLVPSCFAIFTFEPLTFSLTSMPSCNLESLANILIICLILKASDQSNVPDPQDPKRNIQLAGTGLPSTSLDGGTCKSKPLPEGTAKTTPCLERPRGDKDLEGFKPPADMELLTNPVVDPSGNDSKYQSDQT
ncbi:hypothetical protein Tco_1275485 [Tanacetum coccineum]